MSKPLLEPIQVDLQNRNISSALDTIGRSALLMGSVGAGARLAQALPYLFGRARPILPGSDRGAVLEIPVPVLPGGAQRKKKPARPGVKAGNDYAKGLNPWGGWLNLYRDPANPGQASFLAGQQAYPGSPGEIPWYYPGVVLGGLAAGGLGYGAMNSVLARKRKADLKSEIEDARQEYHDALLANYNPQTLRLRKAGAATPAAELARALDELADLTLGPVKQANPQADIPPPDSVLTTATKGIFGREPEQVLPSYGGWGLGMYGTLAGLTALGTGYLAHQYHSKRDPAKLLADIVRERAQERLRRRPAEVHGVPVEVSPHGDSVTATENVLGKLQGEA